MAVGKISQNSIIEYNYRCSSNIIVNWEKKLPQLIKPNEVKVITKNGECQVSIVLELNINLNGDSTVVSAQSVKQEKEKSKSSGFNWEVPDFEASPKIQFGKKE